MAIAVFYLLRIVLNATFHCVFIFSSVLMAHHVVL